MLCHCLVKKMMNVLDMAHCMANQLWKRSVTQNVAPAVIAEAGNFNILEKLGLSWIPNYAPAFYISSKNVSPSKAFIKEVEIFNEPKSFYHLLIEQIKKANQKIILSSLYLGTGILEEKLVQALKKKMIEKPQIVVKLLFDCTRGSRGEKNSRKMVLPLLKDHSNSCQVSLYQPAYAKGSFVPFLPIKYREIGGLHHIKVYLFDNNLIITGANLSNDYFTNRQDRYIFIRDSKVLCDFVEGLVKKISEFSYHLNADDTLTLGNEWQQDPLKTSPKTFNFAASTSINNYYSNYLDNEKPNIGDDHDTVIFPLLEMGPFGIHIDSKITIELLKKCDEESDVHLTTGYFNLTRAYERTIIENSKAKFRILMAHPTANGFYKADFPAGGIPHAYTYLASKFFKKIDQYQQGYRIQMYEYIRPRWTYHAKGLWHSTRESELPFLTMIGSPNFGERSINHDLECQFLLATTNEKLQHELLQEMESLFERSIIFAMNISEPERKVPAWVKAVVFLFRTYL